MLIQFLIKNYASIKDECILSMEPSSDKEHEENVLYKEKNRALNLAAIYGANASGKTSVFKAMTVALVILRQSNFRQVNDFVPVVPFKFDEETIKSPSLFEFTFIANDGLKYIYGFSATSLEIAEEYLYVYKSSKRSMIFERNHQKYSFSRSEKNNLAPLVRLNTPNKLFLATATAWNVECTNAPYKWLSESIDTCTNDSNMLNMALERYANDIEGNVAFTNKLMKQADINISDIDVQVRKVKVDITNIIPAAFLKNVPENMPSEQVNIDITTHHVVVDEAGNERTFDLKLNEESLGTIQLFSIAPTLRETLEKGKVMVVDEIDRSLHPFIVKHLVNLFRDSKINNKGAQLIFTTHETTLLSLNTFRRDQVFFTEKDSNTGATSLYSLDEYAVRKDENIEKGYLLGRYGAIPFLQTEELV